MMAVPTEQPKLSLKQRNGTVASSPCASITLASLQHSTRVFVSSGGVTLQGWTLMIFAYLTDLLSKSPISMSIPFVFLWAVSPRDFPAQDRRAYAAAVGTNALILSASLLR